MNNNNNHTKIASQLRNTYTQTLHTNIFTYTHGRRERESERETEGKGGGKQTEKERETTAHTRANECDVSHSVKCAKQQRIDEIDGKHDWWYCQICLFVCMHVVFEWRTTSEITFDLKSKNDIHTYITYTYGRGSSTQTYKPLHAQTQTDKQTKCWKTSPWFSFCIFGSNILLMLNKWQFISRCKAILWRKKRKYNNIILYNLRPKKDSAYIVTQNCCSPAYWKFSLALSHSYARALYPILLLSISRFHSLSSITNIVYAPALSSSFIWIFVTLFVSSCTVYDCLRLHNFSLSLSFSASLSLSPYFLWNIGELNLSAYACIQPADLCYCNICQMKKNTK